MVGIVAAVPQQGMRHGIPVTDFGFQFGMNRGVAGYQRRSGGGSPIAQDSLVCRLCETVIFSQVQVIVIGEVEGARRILNDLQFTEHPFFAADFQAVFRASCHGFW